MQLNEESLSEISVLVQTLPQDPDMPLGKRDFLSFSTRFSTIRQYKQHNEPQTRTRVSVVIEGRRTGRVSVHVPPDRFPPKPELHKILSATMQPTPLLTDSLQKTSPLIDA